MCPMRDEIDLRAEVLRLMAAMRDGRDAAELLEADPGLRAYVLADPPLSQRAAALHERLRRQCREISDRIAAEDERR